MIRSHPDGSLLTVWVVPGARRSEVTGAHGDALRVRVAAVPERGQANRAVAELLSKALGRRVRLTGGASSRRKRYVVIATTPEELQTLVDPLL